ncbi:hypothetical protein ACHAXT_010131 [Thalassiosira profunda]
MPLYNRASSHRMYFSNVFAISCSAPADKMSKPAAKRKKSSTGGGSGCLNELLADLDLGDQATKPKDVANALLSLLPNDATKQHSSAKKLAKAFPLVMAELDARANKLARQAHQVGARQPIRFSFADSGDKITLPEECFANVLHFLDGREVVNASLASKVWLSATRSPQIWEDGIDMSRLNLNKALNMTSLLKLLGRPQFASLRALALPYKVKLGKNSVKQISQVCPQLEICDLGYYSKNTKAKDADLFAVTEYFPNLTSLRTDMWNVTTSGIASAVRAMGDQLLDLRISGDTITRHYPSRMTMDAIISSCPNLEYFAYRAFSVSMYYNPDLDGVTGAAIVRLVQGCRRLKTLELHCATHVKKEHFLEIANTVANDLDSFALRTLKAVGYDGGRTGRNGIDEYLDPFDVRSLLQGFAFLKVEDQFSRPTLGRGIMFLGKRTGD